MISIDSIKPGSQFVVTAAGAKDVIHQLPSFTPVVRSNAIYPNNDRVFYPNGLLPDGADRPVPVAQGLKLEAGMVITVDQLVYHCARTAGDQKAYQCVHGTVARHAEPLTGYFYLTYAGVTRVDPYTASEQRPVTASLADTKLTVIAGSMTLVDAAAKGTVFTRFEKQVREGTPDRNLDEEWLPDAIIDYHCGLYTNISYKADPRFLLGPGNEGKYWPLGVGGWVLLGFDNGFPAGSDVFLRYKESKLSVSVQHIHVWIAKIDVDPVLPVRYLDERLRTPCNVYSASAAYVDDYRHIAPLRKWAGNAWQLVGTTQGRLGAHLSFDSVSRPGIYHYMLIVDSRDPDNTADESEPPSVTPKGGPDIESISVFRRSRPIHFLLLIDGSRSERPSTSDPEEYRKGIEKYRKVIAKCVAQAWSLSRRSSKELTIFFIREDYNKETGKLWYDGTNSVETIAQGIMDNLESGWTAALGHKTPLAETVNLAIDFAQALDRSKWIPSVIIVSDGIADPEGNYNTKDAAGDDIRKGPHSKILASITGSDKDVNKAFTRLGSLDVAHVTRLVGPWLKGHEIHEKIIAAYATFKSAKDSRIPLLDIVYGLDGDINHESVYHTDCRLEKTDNHRIRGNGAKRLIRVYNDAGNEGFQRCPSVDPMILSGSPENLESYSSVLDRDVHVAPNVRANYTAIFQLDTTRTRWKKVKQADANGDWRPVLEETRYTLGDKDVWTPVP